MWLLFVLIFLFTGIGCSGPLKQASISANEFYRAPYMDGLNSTHIGFLTTAVSRGNGLGEYRMTVSDIIEKTFREDRPGIGIVTAREALNRINSSGMTNDYAVMLQSYDITGILDKKVLARIGEILDVKYIVQPKLSSFTERTSTRLSAFGLSLISTRETTVKISLQVWDTNTGDIVWEGSGQATVAVEALRAKSVSFEEVAEAASKSLIKKFP